MLVSECEYDIVANHGHYDVYIEGEFFCSADTFTEAMREIETGG